MRFAMALLSTASRNGEVGVKAFANAFQNEHKWTRIKESIRVH
jgi:hypothetical protein